MSIMIDDVLLLPKTDFNHELSVGDEYERYGLKDTRDEHNPVSRDVIVKVIAVHDDNYEVKIIDIVT